MELNLKLPVLFFFDPRCIEREACACVVWFDRQEQAVRSPSVIRLLLVDGQVGGFSCARVLTA